MRDHREGKPQHHARRIRADWLFDEASDISEALNGSEFRVDLLLRKPQNSGVEIDILASGEFRRESGAEFEQRGTPAVHAHRSRRRTQNAGYDLQQRALAGAVRADNPERFA